MAVVLLPVTGDAAAYDDQKIKDRVQQIISEVEALRGLQFRESLGSELITAGELREYLTAELESQIPPEKEEAIELVYGQLGLIPTDRGLL